MAEFCSTRSNSAATPAVSPIWSGSGEVAMHQRRQSQSCNSASGSRACDGAHDRDGPLRRRSRDRLADLADRRGISLCIKPRGLLTSDQAAKVDALKGAAPDFTAMRRLAMRFLGILRSKDIQKFDVWLNDAQQSGIYPIHRFARTLRRDVDAVRNSLTEGRSNGQTEGQINRLKTLKRAMYGRASTELLRGCCHFICLSSTESEADPTNLQQNLRFLRSARVRSLSWPDAARQNSSGGKGTAGPRVEDGHSIFAEIARPGRACGPISSQAARRRAAILGEEAHADQALQTCRRRACQ